jgi:hypothetical protein
MWFANRHDEGVIYHRYFNPIPTTTMALLLAVVRTFRLPFFISDAIFFD